MGLQLSGVDELDKALNLRDKAANAAQNGSITSEDTELDDGQQYVVHEMGDKVAKGRSDVASRLENHSKRLGEISAELEGFHRQSFPETVDGSVEITLRGREEEYKKTKRVEKEILKALKGYRLRYRINRPALYPEWRVMHWAIVLFLFFLESILNAQFFAKASPFGLIGGWLQAAVISATNIGLGLLGGMAVLPWRNHVELTDKSTKGPTILAATLCFFLLIFNLATAHYRVLLEDQPKQAITLAISHLWRSPFGINNFDAWVLLFVGIMFTTVAWIEGYKSDDPLREYGRLSRLHEKARDEIAAQKTAIRAEAVNQIKENKSELMTAARQSKTMLTSYSGQIARCMAEANEYREWRARMEEATRTLLSRYRSYYLRVDELDPKPAYFDKMFSLSNDTPFLEEEERIKKAEDRLPYFNKIVEDLETTRHDAIEQERGVISQVQKAVDKFFAHIEGVAAKDSEEAIYNSSASDSEAEEATSREV